MKVMKNAGHNDWRTPPWLWRRLDTDYGFEVDAAARPDNTLCRLFISPAMDATTAAPWDRYLEQGRRQFFLNPPFNNIEPFLARAWEAANRGARVVCLLPARVEVTWAHEIVYPFAHEIFFVKGRVRYYHGSRNGKPNFPSMVVVFGPGIRRGPIRLRTIER